MAPWLLGVVLSATAYEPVPRASGLAHELFVGDAPVGELPAEFAQVFPESYSEVPGVLTFRGGPARSSASFGSRDVALGKLELTWTADTGRGGRRWGGGAGWTGEPVLVVWPEPVRAAMGLAAASGGRPRVEVIQGSLDGHVYFFDLWTGARTRPPIDTGNPIKGSVMVDPRGYPLLFVGQGIPGRAPIGLRIYDLVTRREVFFLPGRDALAPRGWGAFDGSGLVNRATDSLVVPGENGLVYVLKLDSRFDAVRGTVSIAPRVLRYRYRPAARRRRGIESSLAASRNLLFFADNGGTVQAVDGRSFAPVWALDAGDDTDATITVEEEAGVPYLYTGTEVDRQGARGKARLRKVHGLTGAAVWERDVPCHSVSVPRHLDGGLLATNVIGRGDVADRVIFTVARCTSERAGLILALAKRDGRELWRRRLARYAWSSPTDVTSREGHTYLLQADIGGLLHLLDARTGAERDRLQLGGLVEASPAVYDDMAVIVTRAPRVYGVRIR